MDNFELPTNVRQIGSIETSGLRIYVEDYVFTFVQQYTQAHSGSERLGILVGRCIETAQSPILFISGAIEGKYAVEGANGIEFSKKTKDYVSDMLDTYFPGLTIVGWLQSQPGYGTYLSAKNYSYHKENYKSEFQVLFVTDPVQRLDTFYVYNEDGELKESGGYFVYYDKNKPMHEYMIDNKAEASAFFAAEKAILQEAAEDTQEQNEDIDDIKSLPVSKRRIRELREATENGTRYKGGRQASPVKTSKLGGDSPSRRRPVNMLASLSAVMFILVLIMGAGLIRSDERINVLEEDLAALSMAYRNLSEAGRQDVPAFAWENPEPPDVRAEISLAVTEDGNRLLAEENARAAPPATAAPGGEVPAYTAQGSRTAAEAAFAPAEPAPAPAAPVQAPAEPAPASPAPQALMGIPATYTVQRGDNLLAISQRVYGSADMVQRIMEANGIEDADRIYFGQVLILPQP